jgi:choice-of-anchor B domain-containing protein
MMKLAILASLLGLAFAKSVPSCVVSDWSEWSACKGRCPAVKGQSWDAGQGEYFDEGRVMMRLMMEEKAKQWAKTEACIADGSCPDIAGFNPARQATDCVNGDADGYPCRNINLSSFTDFVGLGSSSGARGNDIWGWHDGEEEDYAIVGMTTGSSFVRITDPENVEVLGFLPSQTASSTWRDMKVVNDHAFIVSEASGHGMQVFDLTRLRGLSADSTRRFSNDAFYPGVGNSHNIASNPATNTVFIIGATRTGSGITTCSGGIHMIDVSDPKNPRFDGCFSSDGYSHDIECVIYTGPDSRYSGNEICFGYNENTLTVVDISDRSNPVQLSRTSYSGYQYTHQGWLTTDQKWLLLDDELDENYSSDKRTRTYIWNVQDLTVPKMNEIFYSTETAIDHNMYIYNRPNGDWVFQSNYEAGLRLLHFDLTRAENQLTEYAYFDVYPSSTTATFEGTWSNYPFDLTNGAVAMTSINYGFFMVTPDWAAIDLEVAAKKVYGERQSFRSILSFQEGAMCPKLNQIQSCEDFEC